MSRGLEERRVFLTGCAANIGRATARRFAAEGARLALVDRDPAGADTAAAIVEGGGTASFTEVDVSDAAQVRSALDWAVSTLGGLDTIVNNAGVQRAAPVAEMELDDWEALMGVNARSCFLVAKYGVPILRREGGGTIVNMASLAALKGPPGLTGYAASKGAIVSFTKALAAEVAADGIRVNALCPGWVDTDFNQPAIELLGGRPALEEAVAAAVPLGRQGDPEEIASAMLFLASDASSYMTGQALVVDGGVF